MTGDRQDQQERPAREYKDTLVEKEQAQG